jgi:hypothetical protein
MFELKPLSHESVDAALEKMRHYRALNEPREAESICRDILATDPDNREAFINLILALTDQFVEKLGPAVEEAGSLVTRLQTEYERSYYSGIVAERRAKAQLSRGAPGCGSVAYEGLLKAMAWYEIAEKVRPPGDDNAILRWNTCARLIMQEDQLRPAPTDDGSLMLE